MKRFFSALFIIAFLALLPSILIGQSADNGYKVPAIDFRIDSAGVTQTNPKDNYRRMRFNSSGLPYYLTPAGVASYFTIGGTTALSANRFIFAGTGGAITAKSPAINGQLLIGHTSGAPDLATLTGTANQVTVTNGPGSITLSTPQDLATTSTPSFGGLTIGSGGTAFTKILSASATLDFANTSTQTSSELTITVTGAAVGDPVFIGLPAAPDANVSYMGYVSATNTVTIRMNNYSAGSVNPASGTYRAAVVHF